MSIGDALRDMPDEYKEYVETKEPEQSEADKAIADGLPRWIKMLAGWGQVYIVDKETRHSETHLVFRRVGEKSDYLALPGDMEILPYGETPPPAEPEKPEESLDSDKVIRQKLEHAKKHQYLVAVGYNKDGKRHFFSGVIRCIIDDVTVSFREPLDIDLSSVRSVDLVIDDMPTAEPQSHTLNHDSTVESIGKAVDVNRSEDSVEYRVEKPEAVASIVFKHDGGEWLHMAEQIDIGNHLHEGYDHRGWKTYTPSSAYSFTLDDKYLGYVPAMHGKGALTVTMLRSGQVYKGKGVISDRRDTFGMDGPRTDRIVFSMKRNSEPAYEPDRLSSQWWHKSLPPCPDCDHPAISRSMLDGIEQWCPVCNVKVAAGPKGDDVELASIRNQNVRYWAQRLVDKFALGSSKTDLQDEVVSLRDALIVPVSVEANHPTGSDVAESILDKIFA